jgi:RHS repeat-associated protein
VYGSFGNLTASTGTLTNSFRYTAREFDGESGFHYYRARYYDSTTGRFISEDPLRFFSDIDFYRYVLNNPTNFIDPLGLRCTCVYHQSTGVIRCTDNETGEVVAQGTGYAGFGQGVNNPAMQGVENTGPLPQGAYTIGSPNRRRGPLTLPLTPKPGTDLLGRPGGFLIHGDNRNQNQTASHGCIIQSRDVRQAIADCDGGDLNVEE